MLNIISDRSTNNESIWLEIPLWEEETKGKNYLDVDNNPFIIMEDLKSVIDIVIYIQAYHGGKREFKGVYLKGHYDEKI